MNSRHCIPLFRAPFLSMKNITKVGVLGAGTMGRGIAQVCAQAGFETAMYDVSEDVLKRALDAIASSLEKAVQRGKLDADRRDEALSRISTATRLDDAAAGADIVVEAVPEILEIKQSVFSELDRIMSADAILATNTSSLGIGAIAESVLRPERFLGLHFFNPVPVMKLLEIIRGRGTSDETLDRALEFGRRLGKETIVVRDSPGFATSRLGLTLGLEAIRMVESGVASAHDIDRAMELGYNHPVGPLKLTDMVGLDVRLNIARYLYQTLGTETFRPPALLVEMVAQGKLGKKSGQGFYRWDNESNR